jgi:hypothetical protein
MSWRGGIDPPFWITIAMSHRSKLLPLLGFNYVYPILEALHFAF